MTRRIQLSLLEDPEESLLGDEQIGQIMEMGDAKWAPVALIYHNTVNAVVRTGRLE